MHRWTAISRLLAFSAQRIVGLSLGQITQNFHPLAQAQHSRRKYFIFHQISPLLALHPGNNSTHPCITSCPLRHALFFFFLVYFNRQGRWGILQVLFTQRLCSSSFLRLLAPDISGTLMLFSQVLIKRNMFSPIQNASVEITFQACHYHLTAVCTSSLHILLYQT